jgi:hypothetical protein
MTTNVAMAIAVPAFVSPPRPDAEAASVRARFSGSPPRARRQAARPWPLRRSRYWPSTPASLRPGRLGALLPLPGGDHPEQRADRDLEPVDPLLGVAAAAERQHDDRAARESTAETRRLCPFSTKGSFSTKGQQSDTSTSSHAVCVASRCAVKRVPIMQAARVWDPGFTDDQGVRRGM